MQKYFCSHCELESESSFEVFLHIFTDHLHRDIGIDKRELAKEILKKADSCQETPGFSKN